MVAGESYAQLAGSVKLPFEWAIFKAFYLTSRAEPPGSGTDFIRGFCAVRRAPLARRGRLGAP
jgi:hypothetical protein